MEALVGGLYWRLLLRALVGCRYWRLLLEALVGGSRGGAPAVGGSGWRLLWWGSCWRLLVEACLLSLSPEAMVGDSVGGPGWRLLWWGSCWRLLVEALVGDSVGGSGWRLLWGGLLLEALGGGSCWRLSLEAMVEGSICECRMLSKRGLKRNLNPAWDVRGRMPASPR